LVHTSNKRENTSVGQAEKEYFDSLWTFTRILWPLKPQPAYVHEIILLVAYHVSLVFPEYPKTH
jgi:hypothetical protein